MATGGAWPHRRAGSVLRRPRAPLGGRSLSLVAEQLECVVINQDAPRDTPFDVRETIAELQRIADVFGPHNLPEGQLAGWALYSLWEAYCLGARLSSDARRAAGA